MSVRRPLLASLAAAAVALGTCTSTAVAANDPVPTPSNPGGVESPLSPGGVPSGPVGPAFTTWPAASAYSRLHPGSRPGGVNDFACRPSPGTRPVVLVPGTGEDAFATWSAYAPKLKAEGLCVFTLNYNPLVAPLREAKPFTGHIRSSAAFLAGFVDRVLAATGADKVDLIGHSLGGGPLAHSYLKQYGGARKVNHLIGLTPSTKGTTLYGLSTLLTREGTLANELLKTDAATHNHWAVPEQLVGSPFLTELGAGGLTQPGVKYTVLATRYDDIVTPWTNTLLDEPGVTTVVMQDVCALDHTDHLGFTYDPVAYQVVVNALLPERARKPVCVYVPGWIQ